MGVTMFNYKIYSATDLKYNVELEALLRDKKFVSACCYKGFAIVAAKGVNNGKKSLLMKKLVSYVDGQ